MSKSPISNMALRSTGAIVSQATTNHLSYPSSNIIDGDRSTFWVTGGIYPDQFIISLASSICIDSINIYCYNVKMILLERCTTEKIGKFEEIAKKELLHLESTIQRDTLTNEQLIARHLRFTIKQGYDHFSAVYQVVVNGSVSAPAEKAPVALSTSEKFKAQFRQQNNTVKQVPASPERILRDSHPTVHPVHVIPDNLRKIIPPVDHPAGSEHPISGLERVKEDEVLPFPTAVKTRTVTPIRGNSPAVGDPFPMNKSKHNQRLSGRSREMKSVAERMVVTPEPEELGGKRRGSRGLKDLEEEGSTDSF